MEREEPRGAATVVSIIATTSSRTDVCLSDSGKGPCLSAFCASDVSIADWLEVIRAEYLEMPGLSLTQQQVERLWGLDRPTGEAVLDALVRFGFLRCTSAGRYIRDGIERIPVADLTSCPTV